ncbi:MAG: hypothetical protein R3208_20430, partial [Ketobacteraceae bacterium]|nr:hypothetical protein [Ketobacteraceae bacterium]
MAGSDNTFNSNFQKLAATLIVSFGLTACGGGGGGGSDQPADDDRGAEDRLTELPAFLESAKADCIFVESGTEVSLQNYEGNLANVTELRCNGATLANLNEINQLTALAQLELPGAGLTDVSALQALSTQLESLNLSGNPLTDLITIGQLTNLNALDLSDTGTVTIDSLVNLLGLTELNLADNSITDLNSLNALINLEQVQLTGNSDLQCAEVFSLADTLETVDTGPIVLPPAHCANAVELGNTSPSETVIDNSLEDPAYDRLVVTGDYALANLSLQKSGEDLSIILNTTEGDKTITFTNWFADNNYRVGIFELPGGAEYSFNQLRDELPVNETLGGGDDNYVGTGDSDVVDGGAGNDVIDGKQGNDKLSGGAGDDVVIGGFGSDTLTGGPGSDVLIGGIGTVEEDGSIEVTGGASHEIYEFNIGDGNDLIVDDDNTSSYNNNGTLRFGEGITEEMVSLERVGDDVVFVINESDRVAIYQWYVSRDYRIASVQFDGSEPVDAVSFVSNLTAEGTEGDDVFEGSSESDNIDGGAGNDVIDGKQGNDKLSGGAGDD